MRKATGLERQNARAFGPRIRPFQASVAGFKLNINRVYVTYPAT